MPYVGDRVVHDADSHFMEHLDWLPGRTVPIRGFEPVIASGDARHHELHNEAGGDAAAAELLVRKNWDALGAFDPGDRARALDLLGFRSQLVFSSFCHPLLVRDPDLPAAGDDDDALYETARAHNAGMAEFCGRDDRLLAVGFVPLDDPERAVAVATDALDSGCAAIEVPSYPTGSVSISHPTFDPLYTLLEQRGSPLLFHVGGGGHLVPSAFEHTGRPRPPRRWERQMLEPALTFMGMPAPVEMALAALAFDGVFQDHPDLRCGVIEQGATWFPAFLRRLDLAFSRFAHHDQQSRLQATPAEYVLAAVRVAPFPFEDLAWLLAQTPGQPYLFGSDYPHDEGGPDPVGECLRHLSGASPGDVDLFFRGNFEHLMGRSLPSALRTSG